MCVFVIIVMEFIFVLFNGYMLSSLLLPCLSVFVGRNLRSLVSFELYDLVLFCFVFFWWGLDLKMISQRYVVFIV